MGKQIRIILAVVFCLTGALLIKAQTMDLQSAMETLVKDKQATVGIAVLFDNDDMCVVNDGERYPLASVMKMFQAVAVLDSMNRAKMPIDTEIKIHKSDLKPNTYSPLRDKYPNEDVILSVKELLEYTLQLSDNNACDILFAHFGGPSAVDRCIRRLGFKRFAIKRTEEDMHKDVDMSYDNWSSPSVAAELADRICSDSLMNKDYQDFLRNTMMGCSTGVERLVKPFMMSDVKVGHKTGSGDVNSSGALISTNDVGFFKFPNGRSYSVAVLVKDSKESKSENDAIIAEVSRLVYEYFMKDDKCLPKTD